MQPKVKADLHNIWMAEIQDTAEKAFDYTLTLYRAKYPKSMEKLNKDRDSLLNFYDFPAEHWQHIRTSNPIKSTFSTVKLRSRKSRNSGSRDTVLSMVFKLIQSAEKKWRRIRGFEKLELIVNHVKFIDEVQEQLNEIAA